VTSMPKITTQWHRFEQLSPDALYEILRFRQSIFVVDQRSPYPDLDGLDQEAWHLLLLAEGTLTGCLRVVPAASRVKIGRVAVAAKLRGQGLGRKLMGDALLFCRTQYPSRLVALTAQAYLVPFYQSFGFEPTGAPFDDFGVAHLDMELSE